MDSEESFVWFHSIMTTGHVGGKRRDGLVRLVPCESFHRESEREREGR